MIVKAIAKKTGQYSLLLACILTALVLLPLLEGFLLGHMILNGWCLLSMTVLVKSLHKDKKSSRPILIIGSTLLMLIAAQFIGQILNRELDALYRIILPTGMLFFLYCIWIILSSMFKQKQITADLLSGAIVSYLLLGITWGVLYAFIELLAPASFLFSVESDLQAKGSALFYYSFVTLTTLGYGDILPISRIARSAAYLEAVAGVMYTAILIAVLVGNFGGHKHIDSSDDLNQ
ncbi:MAG TPA: hypothetical protein DD423_00830 [Opitutae bacterium]|mgnify:CR=1 FL=1|jgi:hypothetical protein|nr:hypothetical protein [Opitutae bacterium]